MDFGSIVLVVNILLLVAGWLLFQQARSDLTARAAQVPILSEVKALQKSIATLLEQLKLEAGQSSTQLEARCVEARDLLAALDRRLEELEALKAGPKAIARRRAALPAREAAANTAAPIATVAAPVATTAAVAEPQRAAPAPAPSSRHQEVYALADDGVEPPDIARRTGYSHGEVELILGLRQRA
jgi:hypothetical protein